MNRVEKRRTERKERERGEKSKKRRARKGKEKKNWELTPNNINDKIFFKNGRK